MFDWLFGSDSQFKREDYEIVQAESGSFIVIGPGFGKMSFRRFKTRDEVEEFLTSLHGVDK